MIYMFTGYADVDVALSVFYLFMFTFISLAYANVVLWLTGHDSINWTETIMEGVDKIVQHYNRQRDQKES